MFYTLALAYSFIFTLIVVIAGYASARSPLQIFLTTLFIPVLIYFARRILTQLIHPILLSRTSKSTSKTYGSALALQSSQSNDYLTGEVVSEGQVDDINKRLFLKLIGSAGLATFIFALFKQDAQAAFFGSVPGPGTVSLKDTTGRKIDPAEKGPTDGFEITQVDDSTIPSYYGFINKEGSWYIAREGNGGEYRYIKGNTDFATSWTSRASLVYDYFNNVF